MTVLEKKERTPPHALSCQCLSTGHRWSQLFLSWPCLPVRCARAASWAWRASEPFDRVDRYGPCEQRRPLRAETELGRRAVSGASLGKGWGDQR